MKIAYLDCFSGISGDMFLGALLDAGVPLDQLKNELIKLHLPDPYEIEVEKAMRGAIQASQVTIHFPDHDHTGEDSREPDSDHAHSHDHHHMHQRNLHDIAEIIAGSQLSPAIQKDSLAVFKRLAEAEGKIHGKSVEEVHFHEVGALDSILDIVGTVIGLDLLGIEQLYASPVPMGSGSVQTQHGILPLPAPATLELLAGARAPVTPSTAQLELVTPTGAALLATLAAFEQPAMTLTRIGIGAGRRELEWPNIVRLILGESVLSPVGNTVLLETNIDDQNPEVLGHVMGKLLAAGALDVFFTPIYMKKNRPGTMLSIIGKKKDEATLAQMVLTETSTFGLRVQPLFRYEAGRRIESVQTEFGPVPVKLKLLNNQVIQAAPEYEACNQLANQAGVPLMHVYLAAQQAALILLREKEAIN